MQGFVEYVVKGLVDYPEEAEVTSVQRNSSTVFELRLHPDDIGKVIGRSGATIQAVRHLLQVGAARTGQRCSLVIVEEFDGDGDGDDDDDDDIDGDSGIDAEEEREPVNPGDEDHDDDGVENEVDDVDAIDSENGSEAVPASK